MKTTFYFRFCLMLAVACMAQIVSIHAQFLPADSILTDPKVRVGSLPNGVTYYVRKNEVPEKKIEFRLVVRAGSAEERTDQLGLAHFMEHMNFNGMDSFPRNALISYLNSIGVQLGADLNAYTNYDETVFILPIPSDNQVAVRKGFSILEGWASHAILDSASIEKERNVILEESRLSKGANQRLREQYLPNLLNGSLYADRQPIGKDSIIRNFKQESLRSFYHTWYRPDLMGVMVVGDIDPDSAVVEITRHFSHLSNPQPETPFSSQLSIISRSAPFAMVLTDKEAMSTSIRIIYGQGKDTGAIIWQQYRNRVLYDLMVSLINHRLSELSSKPDAPFSYAFAGNLSPIRDWNMFGLSVAPLLGKTELTLSSITAAFESIRQYGFLQTELQRGKQEMLYASEQNYLNEDKSDSRQLYRIIRMLF